MAMRNVLPYVWYPLFFALAIAMFAIMLDGGAPLLAALYLPIAMVALSIVVLELLDPERPDWRPKWRDVRADAAFMIVVQVVMPRVLLPLAVLGVAGLSHDPSQGPWPHHWPLAAQAILMVLLVDLVRYWLHRACHGFPVLWRLHEVHHSPDILYSLNVSRFHPLEKVLHFSLDSLPFVLLGVGPQVIAAYFLLYAVNGFFQHSNVRLRYGFLNYLVGSAETHRWHHARDPKTASCNFGNTTIIWDLLFGTWYLPKNRTLNIGIPDRDYPKDFWSQMFTPFRRKPGSGRGFKSMVADLSISVLLRWTRWIEGRKIARAARDPMRTQHALLTQILHTNRQTTFGQRHDFAAMKTLHDYRAKVPVQEYEALRPYIEAEIERGQQALTAEAPVRYTRTSGTTGKPKDIPLTATHLDALRRIHRASVASQHRLSPEAFAGSILAITSPAFEGMMSNGKPFGSASGVVAGATPALVREKFVLPPEVLTIADSQVKYLLILRLALARRNITYLGTANSSTLLAIMKLYREHEAALIRDLHEGGFFLSARVPAEVAAVLGRRLRAQPARAAELEKLVTRDPRRRIADLWPGLRLVVIWTCASAGIAVAALRKELAPHTHIHELGYLSSEFRGTITLGRRAGSGLPTYDTHFFEFVERDLWDRGAPQFLTLDQLRKNTDYYLIVTTPSGLYRYFINDLVRITGFLQRMPLLKFLQKGKGITNITGEKLYESQVLASVSHVMRDLGRTARFVMMLADEQAQGYRLYVEPDAGPRPSATEFARAVDAQLRTLNIEYDAKRESVRLAPLAGFWLAAGTEEAFKQESVRQGQREGQFKMVALAYRSRFSFDLEPFVERTAR
jgi:sterol desaturase/sphingolipid hydroxylase (fatty acid hydroxylase superfamily)